MWLEIKMHWTAYDYKPLILLTRMRFIRSVDRINAASDQWTMHEARKCEGTLGLKIVYIQYQ